jgi:hypothetical protein
MALSTARVYDAGQTYLEVCNDLAAVAGFSSLGIDAAGGVVLHRYTDPASRAVSFELRDDVSNIVMAPTMTWEFDTFSVPNCVVSVRSSSTAPAMVAVATNDNPMSIYSTVSRRRTVTYVDNVNDIESQDALQARAERVLVEKSSAVESVEVSHPYLPYQTGETGQVLYSRHGIDFVGTVVDKTITLVPGMRCTTRLRRFVRMV